MGKKVLTETIDIKKTDLDYYNRLLSEIDFNEDTDKMEELIKELGARQDDYISIMQVDFKDNKCITIDIASGNNNYYDNIVLYEDIGFLSELYACDCEFELGKDFEIETDDTIYRVVWNIVGGNENEL